jgi:WG containing repeat
MSMELDLAAARASDLNTRTTPVEESVWRSENLMSALVTLAGDLDRLIPGWIARLLEQLGKMERFQRMLSSALANHDELPALDMGNIVAVGQLQNVIQAVRERIDPHIDPIIESLGTLDAACDHYLLATLEHAGPAVAAAVPRLLRMLRENGISRWPSHLARVLANASRLDERVLPVLCEMLLGAEERGRLAAIEVLAEMESAARPAAGQLLTLRSGSDAERCGMIYALSRQGLATREFLGALEDAMIDRNGYVCRAAAHALAKLTPDPTRFVPLLIAACDWSGYLHDESLPEAAVAALGQYGPRAHDALPRLCRFIEGPIQARTVGAPLVREAIERIAPGATILADANAPRRRSGPLADYEPLFAVQQDDKQCYIDCRGQIVLQTRFSSGGPFTENRAIVHDDEGQTFVIDREGRDVFRSAWDEIRPFSEGLAAVEKDLKWGFVDLEGRVVIEPQYDSVTSFAEGLAGFEVGRTEVTLSRAVTWTRSGAKGFIGRENNVVIPATWPDACRFREGRAVVCTGGTMKPNLMLNGREVLSDRKYGYLDRSGHVRIPGKYDLAYSFSEGLAVVQMGHDICRARYGYIDPSGSNIIPPTLTSASAFKEGRAVVRRRGRKWRGVTLVIDSTGRVLLEVTCQLLEPFSEGLASGASGELYGFVDSDGNWVIERQFDQAGPFKNGLAEVKRGDWYGLIDHAGSFVWGPTTEGGLTGEVEMEWTA